jgi:hypothetical protein
LFGAPSLVPRGLAPQRPQATISPAAFAVGAVVLGVRFVEVLVIDLGGEERRPRQIAVTTGRPSVFSAAALLASAAARSAGVAAKMAARYCGPRSQN